MPCTSTSLIEAQILPGNPPYPLNEGLAPWLRINFSAISSSSLVEIPALIAEVAGEYRKKLGDVCRIVAQFADDIYRVQNFVRTLDFVASAEVISPTQLLITVNGGDAEYQQAVTRLFQTGLPITGINRQDMSLEGLFMNVTKGEVQ